MNGGQETRDVKVVFIGESGCGKSTLIRHLAKNPSELKYASSKEGHAGTTKVSVEYIFGNFTGVELDSVICNLRMLKDSPFESYLQGIEEVKNLDKSSDNYEDIINSYAKQYLNKKSIEELYKEINKTFIFNFISIKIPVNQELYSHMQLNRIDRLRVVDTRGLGDKDNIERVIPFAGADAIMIFGKSTPPNPSILNGLVDICKTYSHVPVLFVGTHSTNEDEVNVTSNDSIETYLTKLAEYNKTDDCQIKHLYADVCAKHLKLIEPVQKIMSECRINHIPFIKSLTVANSETSKYYKFYVPACIQTFKNCIKTISQYQIAQKDVSNKLNGENKTTLFNAIYKKNILDKMIGTITIVPRDYDKYVDFVSVATGVSQRDGSPLDYSYKCVAATLRTMLKESIDQAVFSSIIDSNSILSFLLNRVLEHNSSSWYWGYYDEYYYFIIQNYYTIVHNCKQRLKKKDLQLDRVICTRFDHEYNKYQSIQILLFEEALLQLINQVDNDNDVTDYFTLDNNHVSKE